MNLSFSPFLLAFTALFSIINPLSGAFIFFGATRELEPKVRAHTARWVAIYSFAIVAASLYIGAYVLGFFGISLPVLPGYACSTLRMPLSSGAAKHPSLAPSMSRPAGSPSTPSPCP